MFFSEKFQVSNDILKSYGAVDISLICDVPLFVDPMLIFNSSSARYKELHNNIIRYFYFLYTKATQGLTTKEIDAWFNFSEVPNNWLGYSLYGNKGLALGKKYAHFLYDNIAFAVNTHSISKSTHIEKVMLLYEGSGKDKISDLTVNLIKGFLCEYTEKFALNYIKREFLEEFPVDKAYFNYDTESFISKEFTLPYIYNEDNKKEYVLLTPCDILREDEPAINKKDFFNSYDRIRTVIENDSLRTYVNNYISLSIRRYEENQRKNRRPIKEKSIKKVARQAFQDVVKEYPEIYDYYIKLRETDTDKIRSQCLDELNTQLNKLCVASKNIINLFKKESYQINEMLTAREEAKQRLKFFKHIIEDCDGYKNLYVKGVQIAQENDLQRLFRFVWYGTTYKVDSESNNGRGQTDFIISKGQDNQNIVEFKLASNSKLAHVFTQVKIYEAANCTDGSLIVIFYFSKEEQNYAEQIIKSAGYENMINEAIFLIDCRNDNKISASKA